MTEIRAVEPVNTVVIAVDGSSSSEHAFNWAITNILRDFHEIVLIHVRTLKTGPHCDGINDQLSQESHDLVSNLGNQLKAMKYRYTGFCLIGDNSAETFIEKCRELEASMIIVGRRGISGIEKIFGRSFGEYCLRNGSCPVAVVNC